LYQKDKTPTITSVLLAFCEQAKAQEPPLPLTSQVISNKAAAIANDLLREYEKNNAIMEDAEVKAIKKMTFSTSWACDVRTLSDTYLSKQQQKKKSFRNSPSGYCSLSHICVIDCHLRYFVTLISGNIMCRGLDKTSSLSNFLTSGQSVISYGAVKLQKQKFIQPPIVSNNSRQK
jgi:hypothetical protein